MRELCLSVDKLRMSEASSNDPRYNEYAPHDPLDADWDDDYDYPMNRNDEYYYYYGEEYEEEDYDDDE